MKLHYAGAVHYCVTNAVGSQLAVRHDVIQTAVMHSIATCLNETSPEELLVKMHMVHIPQWSNVTSCQLLLLSIKSRAVLDHICMSFFRHHRFQQVWTGWRLPLKSSKGA